MLVFALADRRFGLPLEAVREVLRAVWISPLPGAPAMVEGVFDLRGRAVPVLDLRARLGVPVPSLDPAEQMVVASVEARTVAFRVDRVEGITSVPAEAVASAAALAPGASRIDRVASDAAGIVFVHDPSTFLSAAEEGDLERALGVAARGAAR